MYFHSEALEIFAWIVPVKLNFESIVDRRGSKVSSLLTMAVNEISEAAPRLLCVIINLIYQSFQQY